MLKIPFNSVRFLVRELIYQEELAEEDTNIYDIKFLHSNEKTYFLGTCLINRDYFGGLVTTIYLIDFISLSTDENYWESINEFNEKGVTLITYYEDDNDFKHLTEFKPLKPFKSLIKAEYKFKDWNQELRIKYEIYIAVFISKLIMLGELKEINYSILLDNYLECYGDNLSAVLELNTLREQIQEDIRLIEYNHPLVRVI